MRKIGILLVIGMLLSMSFAGNSGITGVTDAVKNLCKALKDLLPVAAMLMIIIAGVIYASGQMMGAETRARANVWATAALTGALIAILIAVIAPAVLDQIYSGGANSIAPSICG